MVTVYFEMENSKYCEKAAIFDNEATYTACLPALEKLAKENGFDYISESVDEEAELP